MTGKLNWMTVTGLFMLLAGTAAAQTTPDDGALGADVIGANAADSDTDIAGESRAVNNTEGSDKKTTRPVKSGYGIGYEYRMRHRNDMARPQYGQRPERPEHPPHMDRPERPDRPERMSRPELPERPVAPARPTRPERPERLNR